tara:strand:- start:928 stop:1062 length:135 start_codon:yes stop_codon:yes gene_type:complete
MVALRLTTEEFEIIGRLAFGEQRSKSAFVLRALQEAKILPKPRT